MQQTDIAKRGRRIRENGPLEGRANHEWKDWLSMLERAAQREDGENAKYAEDARRALAKVLGSIVTAFRLVPLDKWNRLMRIEVLDCAISLADKTETLAESHTEEVQQYYRDKTVFVAKVPALVSDRKNHLKRLAEKIKPGVLASGVAKGKGRKSHSLETPINRFLGLILNKGYIEYRGEQHRAPWRDWIALVQPRPPQPPPVPLANEPCSPKVMDRWLDDFIMLALRKVLENDIRNLQHMPAFKGLVDGGRKSYRTCNDPLHPLRGQGTPERIAAEVWLNARTLIRDAFKSMALVQKPQK